MSNLRNGQCHVTNILSHVDRDKLPAEIQKIETIYKFKNLLTRRYTEYEDLL